MVTLPMPHFPSILPFPPLDFVIILIVALLLIALVSNVPLLIDLSPLQARPLNIGLHAAMCASVNFIVKDHMIMMGHPLSLCDSCPGLFVIRLCCSPYLYLVWWIGPGFPLPRVPYIFHCM
jgi:hypothetical protein